MKEDLKALQWVERQPAFPQVITPDPWMGLDGVEGEVIDVTTPEGREYLQWTRQDPRWDFLKEPRERKELPYTPKLVLVFGPSGAGKDSVVEQIKAWGGNSVQHISSDWYYGPFGRVQDRILLANDFDHPNSIDWDLLLQNLSQLRLGFIVEAPDYDFPSRSRSVDQTHILEPRPLIVVSGILAANDRRLREEADLVIGVHADWETCVKRRVERDVRERARIAKECYEQIESSVRPRFEEFVQPHMLSTELLWRDNDGKHVWVDNSMHADSPSQFPVVVNRQAYLKPIENLLQ